MVTHNQASLELLVSIVLILLAMSCQMMQYFCFIFAVALLVTIILTSKQGSISRYSCIGLPQGHPTALHSVEDLLPTVHSTGGDRTSNSVESD